MSPCPEPSQGSTPITGSPDGLYLYPPPARAVPEGGVYAELDPPVELPGRAEGRPRVMVNMVSTADGRAAIGGKAGGIGGEADRCAMRNLRAAVDAVLIGAGTLRAERMSLAVPERLAKQRALRGKPPQPLAVVLSRSGDLPLEVNLIGASPENTLVLLPKGAPPEVQRRISERARVRKLPPQGPPRKGDGVDLVEMMRCLRESYSVESLLVEGGPELNGKLVGMDLVDELFLTLSPKLAGGNRVGGSILEGPPLAGESRGLRLVSVAAVEDELFVRYALPTGAIRNLPTESTYRVYPLDSTQLRRS